MIPVVLAALVCLEKPETNYFCRLPEWTTNAVGAADVAHGNWYRGVPGTMHLRLTVPTGTAAWRFLEGCDERSFVTGAGVRCYSNETMRLAWPVFTNMLAAADALRTNCWTFGNSALDGAAGGGLPDLPQVWTEYDPSVWGSTNTWATAWPVMGQLGRPSADPVQAILRPQRRRPHLTGWANSPMFRLTGAPVLDLDGTIPAVTNFHDYLLLAPSPGMTTGVAWSVSRAYTNETLRMDYDRQGAWNHLLGACEHTHLADSSANWTHGTDISGSCGIRGVPAFAHADLPPALVEKTNGHWYVVWDDITSVAWETNMVTVSTNDVLMQCAAAARDNQSVGAGCYSDRSDPYGPWWYNVVLPESFLASAEMGSNVEIWVVASSDGEDDFFPYTVYYVNPDTRKLIYWYPMEWAAPELYVYRPEEVYVSAGKELHAFWSSGIPWDGLPSWWRSLALPSGYEYQGSSRSVTGVMSFGVAGSGDYGSGSVPYSRYAKEFTVTNVKSRVYAECFASNALEQCRTNIWRSMSSDCRDRFEDEVDMAVDSLVPLQWTSAQLEDARNAIVSVATNRVQIASPECTPVVSDSVEDGHHEEYHKSTLVIICPLHDTGDPEQPKAIYYGDFVGRTAYYAAHPVDPSYTPAPTPSPQPWPYTSEQSSKRLLTYTCGGAEERLRCMRMTPEPSRSKSYGGVRGCLVQETLAPVIRERWAFPSVSVAR